MLELRICSNNINNHKYIYIFFCIITFYYCIQINGTGFNNLLFVQIYFREALDMQTYFILFIKLLFEKYSTILCFYIVIFKHQDRLFTFKIKLYLVFKCKPKMDNLFDE